MRIVIAMSMIVAGVPQSPAFGPDGHRIVAELAQRRLSPPAMEHVGALLARGPDTSLADIANWADDVRKTPEYRWSAPLHYVNFPRSSCNYDAERDCPEGRCIVGAIERHAGILGDASRPTEERREALKFIVHFVADLHQPLHAGYADDKGGNLFQVSYLGHGSNLHALWDGGILRLRKRGWREYADALHDMNPRADVRWSPEAPRQWAQASCRLIADARIYPQRPGRLESGYVERLLPVVEKQLVLASARLASLLNVALDPEEQMANGQ